ncbi:MAG: helix-turn-helix transcriptional regulator [Hyphomicrobiales bacterium]|nr:helix-turn-helix transcriptional regulator [Hyphomicrobiales bacterium]
MRKREDLLLTVEAVHAAGLDETLWPNAMASMSRLFGSIGATMESVDKKAGVLTDFWSHGVPDGSDVEYAEHYVLTSPRMALSDPRRFGEIGFDYMLLDEAAMDRDAYYSEFLAKADMRYFIAGALLRNDAVNACVAIQRSPRQGHVGDAEIAMMQSLLPHFQQAYETTRLLRGASRSRQMLEEAFDWLSDGVLVVGEGGLVLFANAAARGISSRGDGVRIVRGRLDFSVSAATSGYERALSAVQRLRLGLGSLEAAQDFHAPDATGSAAYLVSVRPMNPALGERRRGDALALVFIRAIAQDRKARLLAREVFCLTEAEGDLAQALVDGVALRQYADRKRLSMNTIYTHLRHIKAKTGSQRMSELVGKLSAYSAPLGQVEQGR